ncbi:ADP-ribosyl cyclase/cyclic ADP-ribose hydrolase 1 [Nycticebus coucang]|uniref:ADP-ribosyl cyclase/cyclic ADP-ribose hydrolase 1 n=1 Tax=Nycticebus coucang TaxID=9470 RepID=UPI00234C9674|nr:ADP-ribosyl cyclase/cyclic ADP-ribose hydrolase 1 [Nycticebus coucang]
MANYEFRPVSGNKPCCPLSRRAQVCLGVGLLVLAVAVVVAVVVGVLPGRQPPQPLEWKGRGTTKHLAEIVLGRCFIYTQVVRPAMRDVDCHKIWEAFKNAFLSKNPCNITEEDYQPLMKLVSQTIPCNKSVFWSKTSELAHHYTWIRGDMFTLEDTLLGYLADQLSWCGDPGTSEMNYQSCPHWKKDCPNNPGSVFWKLVSRRFAEAACGVVQVVLNGSISNTFDRNSTFGSVEIFNLIPEKVHTLQAWVMHDIRGGSSESCQRPPLSDLKLIISKRNITFICHDNYRLIRFIQCVQNPERAPCNAAF